MNGSQTKGGPVEGQPANWKKWRDVEIRKRPRVPPTVHSGVDICAAQPIPVTMSFLFGKGSKVAKVSDLVKAIKDALASMEKNSKGNEKVRVLVACSIVSNHP